MGKNINFILIVRLDSHGSKNDSHVNCHTRLKETPNNGPFLLLIANSFLVPSSAFIYVLCL